MKLHFYLLSTLNLQVILIVSHLPAYLPAENGDRTIDGWYFYSAQDTLR